MRRLCASGNDMSGTLSITALVENAAEAPGLLAEHGASFWIERNGRTLLVDTGQGMTLGHNAHKLNIPICKSTEALVLSHGHYDHTGGMGEFLAMCPRVALHAHPAAFEEKYSRKPNGLIRSVGIPGALSDRKAWAALSIATTAPMEIIPGVFVTGPIPRVTDFEDTGGDFYLDAACTQPDPLIDDQSLYCRTAQGLVVVLGCAHSGIINTIRYIRTLAGGTTIEAVIGGMHLVNASAKRIETTIAELKSLGVRRVYPTHCTGETAVFALHQAFEEECLPCHVGTNLQFPTT